MSSYQVSSTSRIRSYFLVGSMGFLLGSMSFYLINRTLKWYASRRNEGLSASADQDQVLRNLMSMKADLNDLHDLIVKRSGIKLSPLRSDSVTLDNLQPLVEESDQFYSSGANDQKYQFGSEEEESEEISLPDGISSRESFISTCSTLQGDQDNDLYESLDALMSEDINDIAQINELRRNHFLRCWKLRSKHRQDPKFLWRFAQSAYFASLQPNAIQMETMKSFTNNNYYKQSNSLPEFTQSYLLVQGLAAVKYCFKVCHSRREEPEKDAYLWRITLLGSLAETVSLQDRVKLGIEFKEWLDQAIHKYPEEAEFHILKTRWCLAVCNLSWLEKQIVSRLFPDMPLATINDAFASVSNALEYAEVPLDKFMSHYFMAKCLIVQRNYPEAVRYLNTAKEFYATLPNEPIPDSDASKLFLDLQQQLKTYAR